MITAALLETWMKLIQKNETYSWTSGHHFYTHRDIVDQLQHGSAEMGSQLCLLMVSHMSFRDGQFCPQEYKKEIVLHYLTAFGFTI